MKNTLETSSKRRREMVKLNAAVHPEQLLKVQELADREDLSVSQVVRRALDLILAAGQRAAQAD